jgi:hypothetical protein
MSNPLELPLKSCIHKALQRVLKILGYGVLGFFYLFAHLYGFFWLLAIGCSVLWNFYSVLWIGEPIAITCRNIDFIRVDCTIKHRALLRESEQQIRNVQGIKVDSHPSHADSGDTTAYRVSLQSQSGDRLIKKYANQNDPEVNVLHRRLGQFIEHPEKHLTVPLRYNLWTPIITFLFLLPFVLGIFTYVFGLTVRLIQWVLRILPKISKAINL